MLRSVTSSAEDWGKYEDVPILITPPQEECLAMGESPVLTSFQPFTSFDLGRPMLGQSLPNSSLTSLHYGEPRNVTNLHFDMSDSECEFSGYGSFIPSPIPSPMGETFGFEDDTSAFSESGSYRRDSFTCSDTSELNEDVNQLFLYDLPFTQFTNYSTDTLSPPPSTYNVRTRSVSMYIPRASQESENSFPYPSPYANLSAGNQSFVDLPSTVQGVRSRANSMSALPMNTPSVPPHNANYDTYNVAPSDHCPDGYSPVASSPLEQFQASMNGSVESLPNLPSSYHTYPGYGYQYDSNGSSSEYLSLDDPVPATEYYPPPGGLTYSINEFSSHPYPMKGKRGRSHVCHFCQRPFTRKHDLHRHIRVHTGDKPYKCEFCAKTFARTDALKRHFRVDEQCGKAHELASQSKEDHPSHDSPVTIST